MNKLSPMQEKKNTHINLETIMHNVRIPHLPFNDVGHARASQARLLTPISSIFALPCPISNFPWNLSDAAPPTNR